MDFTRQPIIESVITPKEGCRLVIRSSKSAGQEEFFVEAIEVVSFGNALFFRSVERPKAFLVPASDYEVLEVREARMVLKNVGVEKAIKIGGGREQQKSKESERESVIAESYIPEEKGQETAEAGVKEDQRSDKNREKRRYRRRRGRNDIADKPEGEVTEPQAEVETGEKKEKVAAVPYVSSLLPPPPTLISETLARYRDNALFKGAFFENNAQEGQLSQEEMSSTAPKVHPEDLMEALHMQNATLDSPEYGYFDLPEDANPEASETSYISSFEVSKEEEIRTEDKE